MSAFPIGDAATLEELEADPHPLLARLREQEPVSWVPVLGAWLVTRRDLVLQAMRDPETFTVDDPRFSTAQVIGPSMLSLDGDAHSANRDPFARAFRLDAVRERFTEVVRVETDLLIDTFADDGHTELRRSVAGPLAVRVMIVALGLEQTPPQTVLGWYDAIVGAVTDITAGSAVPAAGSNAYAELAASIDRASAGDADSSLVAAAAGVAGGLSSEQVASNAAVLLFGGIETTEGMIANLVLHVLRDEAQRDLLLADPGLLPNAVDESLRLEPAAAVIDRYATRDAELGGVSIGKGDPVTLSIAGANRDPDSFADPDRFDVHRPNANRHVTFAHGPHVCLGMHLARLEAQTALRRLLERLPGLRLRDAHSSAPRGLVFRKPPTLEVLWDG
ncbi:MAG TPA: cytochrome P450 [Gaiellaceae bacterium]|jgi:cytochrome P450|nr:cytochrome P450 [Gaiellaceae bacterium]